MIDALNQPSYYDTLEMQKPPQQVPASLLQSFDFNQLPQNKFQVKDSLDPEEIIKKYSK